MIALKNEMSRAYATANHRPNNIGGLRIFEILDNLRTEYDGLTRDVNLYKLQRDEYERKLQQQFSEAQNIQQQLMEIERNYQKMKQKYEEEIGYLRRQLGITDTSPQGVRRSLPSGEKRSISSAELSVAQDLGNLSDSKRPPPGLNAVPPSPSNIPNGNPAARFNPNNQNPNINPNINPNPNIMPPKPNSKKNPEMQKPAPSSPLSVPTPLAHQGYPGSPKKKQATESTEHASDWIVGYNPSVHRTLEVNLDHDMEHDSVVCCVNFSPHGRYLATGCNHSAQIFDVETGAKIHVFRDKPDLETDLYIRSVCFSPDSTLLATGVEDKTVKLWDIEKGQIKYNLTGHDLDIYSLDFSPDGRLIISGSGDKKVKVWRLEDNKCISTLGDEQNGPKDGVTSVCISPDGRSIAAGSLDRVVRLWDIESGAIIAQYEGHLDSVYSVAFSPDGKTLASGSLDKTVKLWEVNRTQKRCRSLSGHRDFVLSVTFSPDGNWLVSGSKDRSVQFWDPRTALTHMILQGHRNSVISVALSGDKEGSGGKFATGSGDTRARIWQWKA
jgi:glucose repression regulatory protein TUP1